MTCVGALAPAALTGSGFVPDRPVDRILTRKLSNLRHAMLVSGVDTLGRRVTATRTFVIRCSGG